jgi:hypothetical protein
MALPIPMKRFDAGIQNVILDYELKFKIEAIAFYVNLYFYYVTELCCNKC